MNRRKFITLLGGAAAWPLAARAQQGERVRHVGVLLGTDESDTEQKALVSAFVHALADLGWRDGRNIRIDYRWASGDTGRLREQAAELPRAGCGRGARHPGDHGVATCDPGDCDRLCDIMQRTETPWSNGLIERTTCQSSAGSNLFAAVTVHPGLSLNYLIFGHSLNARFSSLARAQKIRIGDLWRPKQRRVGTLPRRRPAQKLKLLISR